MVICHGYILFYAKNLFKSMQEFMCIIKGSLAIKIKF